MDIVEFCEKVCGVKLLEWQKEYLRTAYKERDDNKILSNAIPTQHHDGLKASIVLCDETGPDASYKPVCPRGYIDCASDPAYIQQHYPDWYEKLYGDLTPTEAIYVDGGCYSKAMEDPDRQYYCHDD